MNRDVDQLTKSFSPHTWGWSGFRSRVLRLPSVLPTHVGMVRVHRLVCGHSVGSPHTRGDGPQTSFRQRAAVVFSPHTWGWSDFPAVISSRKVVLPTHVGMVRIIGRSSPPSDRSPPTRGDGPSSVHCAPPPSGFSPHTWGWSEIGISGAALGAVLPTHVGMVRQCISANYGTPRSPHTRGDGPL